MLSPSTTAKYETRCLGGVAGFAVRQSGAPESIHVSASAWCVLSTSSSGTINSTSPRIAARIAAALTLDTLCFIIYAKLLAARAALAVKVLEPPHLLVASLRISRSGCHPGPGQRSRSTHHPCGEVDRQPRIHRSAVAASVHPRLVPNRPRSRDASIQGVELQGPIPPTEAK